MYEAKESRPQRRTNSRLARPAPPPMRVIATYEMDTATFILHMNNRHKESLAPADHLPERIDYRTEQAYRAFHRKLHAGKLPHFHDADPPEAAIDRAIELIMENRDWGWKEIADVYGHVAAFPDGKLATRVDGVILYHGDISEATDRLVEAGRLAKDNMKRMRKEARVGKR